MTKTTEVHIAHVKAALQEYFGRYFSRSIDDIVFIDPEFGKDMTFHVHVQFANKKESNVQKIDSVYDTLPYDTEPSL